MLRRFSYLGIQRTPLVMTQRSHLSNNQNVKHKLHFQVATDPDYEYPFVEIYRGLQQLGVFHQEKEPGKFDLELPNRSDATPLTKADLEELVSFTNKYFKKK